MVFLHVLVKGIEIIPKSLSLYIQKKKKNPNAPVVGI
jgi:hypothetical protein